MVKSVVFMAEGRPILVMVPGDRKASYKKVKDALSLNKLKLATSQEVIDHTGYILGATPPIAHRTDIDTVVDNAIAAKEVVYTGGGELNAMLKIRSQDLIRAAEAKVADVSESLVRA